MVERATELRSRLTRLDAGISAAGSELALFLVYARPGRVKERPALARTYFAERCISEAQLNLMVDTFRSIGAYVEVFDGDRPFLEALTAGRLHKLGRTLLVAYNGIGWGITAGGYEPGRKALVPAVADSYGLIPTGSDAYACAMTRHKFHSFLVLQCLGINAPPVWHYRPGSGWMGPRPSAGVRVIAKSTYEAWSVGVTEESVFDVDESAELRLSKIAETIGQPVTVQEFIAGREVCVLVLECPQPTAMPIVEQILAKAPHDADAVMTIDDNLRSEGVRYVNFEGPDSLRKELEVSALRVFDLMQMGGLGRMDFRIDARGRPWLTDVAVEPGWGLGSSAFASIASLGFDHAAFLRILIAASLAPRGALPS